MKRFFISVFIISCLSFTALTLCSAEKIEDKKTDSRSSFQEHHFREHLVKILEGQKLKISDLETWMSNGKSKDAIHKVEHVLKSNQLSAADKEIVYDYKRDLQTRVLIAGLIKDLPTETYAVHKGDSLLKIEKNQQVPITLLEQLNPSLSTSLQVGQTLKIVPWKCVLEVDTEKKRLKLRVNDKIVKTYPVATGKPESETPVGTFKIANKIKHPTWYGKGVVAKPGDPANTLGTRWLGFDKKGYGIHGTIDPKSVGQATSSGCVRMQNRDVEELFGLVPIGTSVTIYKNGS